MQRKIYVTEFSYGSPSMAEVVAIKETDKTFTVESKQSVLGYMYIPRLLRKADKNCFDTPTEALAWCVEQQKQYIEECRKILAKAEAKLAELETLTA